MQEEGRDIKVLIIENTPSLGEKIQNGLTNIEGIEVTALVNDTMSALPEIKIEMPDIILLDTNLPGSGLIEFLQELLPVFPLPVIVLSDRTHKAKHVTLQVLEAGAIDYLLKPSTYYDHDIIQFINELQEKLKVGCLTKIRLQESKHYKPPVKFPHELSDKQKNSIRKKIVVIGASIGGIQALRNLIPRLPANFPCIVLVQHMSPGLARTFAARLDEISAMMVKEAASGDLLEPGKVLIAPHDFHMKVLEVDDVLRVETHPGELVKDRRPSIDVLMFSAAEHGGPDVYGILLTGCGNDGAEGLRIIKEAGGKTIIQDEESSVLFELPKAAENVGANDHKLHINDIPGMIMDIIYDDLTK